MAATAAFAGCSMVARWAARRVAAHAAVVTALPATQKGSSWSLCQHTHHQQQQQQQQQQRLCGTFAARRMSTVAGTDDGNQQQQQQAPPQGFDASEGSEDEEEVYDSSLEAEDDDDLPSNLVLHEMLDIEQDDTLGYALDEVKELPVIRFTAPGETSGSVLLDNRLFDVEIRRDIVHRVVQWQLAKNRTKVYKAKTRSEVSGGGRKPRPQKNTGRSRHGSIRSPIWRGGGRAHGPVIRDWSQKLPKKVRRLGLAIALAAKYRDRRLVVVDNLDVPFCSTREMMELLIDHNWDLDRLLVVDDKFPDNFLQASRNLKRLSPLPASGANVFSILKMDTVIVTQAALEALYERTIEDYESA